MSKSSRNPVAGNNKTAKAPNGPSTSLGVVSLSNHKPVATLSVTDYWLLTTGYCRFATHDPVTLTFPVAGETVIL